MSRPSFADGLAALDAVQTRTRLAAAKSEVAEHLRWATGPAAETLQAAVAAVDADLLAAARRGIETLAAAVTASLPPPAPTPTVRPTLPAPGRPYVPPRLPARPVEAAPDPVPAKHGLGGISRAVPEADPPAVSGAAETPAPAQRAAWDPIRLPTITRPRPQAPRVIGPAADDEEIPF